MMGVSIDPREKVGKLSVGEKQLVEIARTLQQRSEIVIMDEPNSALNASETERLFAILRRLRDRGLTIIYVSHRLEEVFAIGDRISVIRDGRYQGTWRTAETTIPDVIAQMIGRRLEETFPDRAVQPDTGEMLLDVREPGAGDRRSGRSASGCGPGRSSGLPGWRGRALRTSSTFCLGWRSRAAATSPTAG